LEDSGSAVVDPEAFFAWIETKENLLKAAKCVLEDKEEVALQAKLASESLPPAEEMDKILRYEKRIHKELDWALQRLDKEQAARGGNTSGI
jgi:hypothetical protein